MKGNHMSLLTANEEIAKSLTAGYLAASVDRFTLGLNDKMLANEIVNLYRVILQQLENRTESDKV
jgi:hypothetical protein